MNLNIGPHQVTILSSPDIDVALADDGSYGDADVGKLTIRIRSDVAESVWRETLAHEALHHIWALTPLPATFTSEQEEQVIRGLAPFLTELGLFAKVRRPVE